MDPSPALILQLSGLSAPLRDRLVALLAEHDLVAVQEDDVTAPTEWIAHFASHGARDSAATAMRADPDFQSIQIQPADVPDDDWARRTQADLPPIKIGRITVGSDLEFFASARNRDGGDGIQLLIVPSRGFGTGHHQSTRLCLVLLQERRLSELTVLDVGTGSGILAIAAARLGAGYVAAIDLDPDAVENARENAAANGVQAIVDAHVDDLTTTTTAPADLVMANLTGTLLARHAADLARLVRPAGGVIVSGFNIEERDMVTEALTPTFDIVETAEEEGWYAFLLTKTA